MCDPDGRWTGPFNIPECNIHQPFAAEATHPERIQGSSNRGGGTAAGRGQVAGTRSHANLLPGSRCTRGTESFLVLGLRFVRRSVTAGGIQARAVRRIRTGDTNLQCVGCTIVIKSCFSVEYLRFNFLNFFGTRMRTGQTLPEGLNLVLEKADMRMQRMAHGFLEISLLGMIRRTAVGSCIERSSADLRSKWSTPHGWSNSAELSGLLKEKRGVHRLGKNLEIASLRKSLLDQIGCALIAGKEKDLALGA